jgi:hypothetical protein
LNISEEFSKATNYRIQGSDNHGSFDVMRRYADFDKARQVMIQRWPSCYVPPIPPKKAVGNKSTKFVEDRKQFLEQFLIKLS